MVILIVKGVLNFGCPWDKIIAREMNGSTSIWKWAYNTHLMHGANNILTSHIFSLLKFISRGYVIMQPFQDLLQEHGNNLFVKCAFLP